MTRPRRRPLLALALAGLLAGCGGGERTFAPQEFVDAVNAEGAELTLGDVLTTNEEGVEIREVTFAGDVPGSGTLLTLADSAEAIAELERCESSISLVCFRAANAVLRFEDVLPEDQVRITAAVEALATE